MIGWFLNMVGWPIWATLILMIGAVLWYRLGKGVAAVAVFSGLVTVFLKIIRDHAKAEKKVEEYEADRKAIHKANADRQRSRDDAERGKLFDDDGFRRK